MRTVRVSIAMLLLASTAPAQPPVHIAATDPLSPAKEREALTVPAGFEVQLVAAEPDIDKPLQCAFDAKGRLWVSTTRHYPFAAPIGQGTDKLFVLSDFAPDGKARKIETFANDLNIPIGVLPLPDAKSCILYSIPSVWKYTDTDGDGKADKKEELLTGFGQDDTHGMVNSFTLMPDGWVYATHGFKNQSVVKDRAGHTITMSSGNTFRFRPDGSNLENFTFGQVNPFGLAVDPWFNLYTADCHTKPITQLIRGAAYASFAKPHGGLGYAPHVTDHSHNSTAICGLAWYDADHYPPEYKGRMFLGNVVTNRVNADVIQWKGSTPVAVEQPDFIVSKDPWFRPVDIKLGPDGAMYITDFYNRIIGHYEVPLTHPQRDKDRGRVWRVVWKGLDGKVPPAQKTSKDLTTEKPKRLDELLGHPNLTVRLLATHELIRRNAQEKSAQQAAEVYEAHRQWVERAPRPGEQPRDHAGAVVSAQAMPLLASHEIRIETARKEWAKQHSHPRDELQQLPPELKSLPPHVARAWVDQMTAIPEAKNIRPLAEMIAKIPPEDTHLRYAARTALRNSVMAEGGWDAAKGSAETMAAVADVALAIPTKESARFLAAQAGTKASDAIAEFVGRHGDASDWNRLFAGDVLAIGRLVALTRGVQAAGGKADALLTLAAPFIRQGLEQRDPALARQAIQALQLLESLPGAKETRSGRDPWAPALLSQWIEAPGAPIDIRAEAMDTAGRFFWARTSATLGAVLASKDVPPLLLEKAAGSLSTNREALQVKAVRQAVLTSIKTAPYRTATTLAAGMAQQDEGAKDFLLAVEQGQAPARLLQEKPVLEALKASRVSDLDSRIEALTKNLPPLEQRITDLIAQRSRAYLKAKSSSAAGGQLFTKHCAACHQINSQGGKVGPNLDGIGSRGVERLLEDILDPNRNVDAAFRARTLTLADGRTIRGLLLRVEGTVLVMANEEGKEVRVPEAEIERNVVTNLSPMPANMETALPQKEFLDLMSYLLDQRPK